MKDYIGKNQEVQIREFLENYCSLRCTWRGKMTHQRMIEFLSLKERHVSRGRIGEITKEQKLTGEYLYVVDEVGQIIPYKNPGIELRRLQVSLMLSSDPKKLEEIRLKSLRDENLTYDEYGNVITIEEYEEIMRLERERKEEEIQNKILDAEDAYYERMAERNRQHVKTKKNYFYRRIR